MLLDICVKTTQSDIPITPFRYPACAWYADTPESKFHTVEWQKETVISLPGVTFILKHINFSQCIVSAELKRHMRCLKSIVSQRNKTAQTSRIEDGSRDQTEDDPFPRGLCGMFWALPIYEDKWRKN